MNAREFELLEHRGVSRRLRTGVSKPEISGPFSKAEGQLVLGYAPRI